jgi:hypothetical protein
MFRAISRKPIPDAYAVWISAQVDFGIVRFTKRKDNSKLSASKFDSPALRPDCASQNRARIVFDCRIAYGFGHIINASCTLYGSRRSAIELPGGVNDSSCHEKVDYSCFSALCSGDGAGFLRE